MTFCASFLQSWEEFAGMKFLSKGYVNIEAVEKWIYFWGSREEVKGLNHRGTGDHRGNRPTYRDVWLGRVVNTITVAICSLRQAGTPNQFPKMWIVPNKVPIPGDTQVNERGLSPLIGLFQPLDYLIFLSRVSV
jgi:hypothetical protein